MTTSNAFDKKQFTIWLKYVLALSLVGSIIRLLFYFALSPSDLNLSNHKGEIINAFIRGFRFDLSAISYMTILFLPFMAFKKTPLWFTQIGLNIYRIFLYFWVSASVCDIIFYSFYTDRINLIAFGLVDDNTTAVVKGFWKNYPAVEIFIVIFVLCYLTYYSTRKFLMQNLSTILNADYKFKIILFVALFAFGRGTLSMFPLGPDYAVISSIPFINQLSYGTAHAFMRAVKLRSTQNSMGANAWNSNLKEFGYSPTLPESENKAFEDYFGKKIENKNRFDLMKFVAPVQAENSKIKNVILLVMESWGTYGISASHPPDFDLVGKMQKHFDQDFINLHFLANTPGTAGSLSCILAGIPQRAISPFLTESSYLNTPLSTSPAFTYKKQNYETHFLYGGNPGWRDINKYALTQGFDFIEGEIDVKKTLNENNIQMVGTHDWGIYDEDLFKYINLKLKEKSEKKKLYVVMTTTNHPPFELPPKYDVKAILAEVSILKYPEHTRIIDSNLAQERFKTYRYTSDALAQFIDVIKNSELKKSTLIAATGDHSSWLVNFNSNERFIKDTVPFYIYIPENVRKSHRLDKNIFETSFGGHMDIWPTLYNLSLNHSEYETFGADMFIKKDLTFALNNSRLIASSTAAVFVHNGDQSSYFDRDASTTADLFETNITKTSVHEALDLKYKSLMGALDSYLDHSKNPKVK
ncbi:MAG: LTA synthase family protein [Bdellovibrionaceae bacterium]|nr:LTA synthase family protein [Pseudobdellovibrionaceae bacterium]